MEDTLASALVRRFDAEGVRAIVLAGSHARGDAGPHSDVDLIRFVGEQCAPRAEAESHLVEDHLVVVSDVSPAAVEEWFLSPKAASEVVGGLRTARALLDRDGTFASVQARARSFRWDAEMQRKADAWASRQMVGWIEEVQKGLEGLRRDDTGRLLHARHGCSWGLSRVVQVQRGVLLSGDNAFFEEVAEAVGRDSEWSRVRRTAFGVAREDGAAPTLREQVLAGLRLYALTAELLAGALGEEDEPLVTWTVRLIRRSLGEAAA